MRNLAKILTGVLLFFLFTATTTAEITSVKIQSDNQDVIVFKHFGFRQNGHVSIAISSASVTSAVTSSLSQPDPSHIGFFLISQDELFRFQREDLSCDLDSKFISILFTFQDLSPPPNSSFNKSYVVTYPNMYTLRFANCNPITHVTMDVRTELYNTDMNGITKEYLSTWLAMLPSLYFVFSRIYLFTLGFWIFACFKNHSSFHRIHLLMGVLLLMKGLNLFCAGEVQDFVNVTGTRPHGWDVLFYIFQFVTVVLSYTVIMVGETKKTMMIVIPLQVLVTVFKVRGENSPLYTASVDWVMLAFLVNCIGICAVFIPMCCCAPYETKAARSYSEKFAPFLTVGLTYLIIDLIFGVIVTFSNHWVSNSADEIVGLVFYMVMLAMFWPFEKNEYLVARVRDEDFEV